VIQPLGNHGLGLERQQKDSCAQRCPQTVLKYWIARVAPYWNITWNIAGEWDELFTPAELDDLGAFIKASDPWKHPLTSHALNTTADRPWVDFRVEQFSAGTSSDAASNARKGNC